MTTEKTTWVVHWPGHTKKFTNAHNACLFASHVTAMHEGPRDGAVFAYVVENAPKVVFEVRR